VAEGAPLPLVDLAVPPFPDLPTSGDAAGLGADLAEPTAPAAIVEAAIERHGLCAAAAEHRIGTVPLSEPSVLIAVSAPHRDAAFEGAREIIDEIKARAPIFKREEGEWVEGTTPGPPSA